VDGVVLRSVGTFCDDPGCFGSDPALFRPSFQGRDRRARRAQRAANLSVRLFCLESQMALFEWCR